MALLQKLKSILGLGGSDRDSAERREVGVTVEREGGDATAGTAGGDAGTASAATSETAETPGEPGDAGDAAEADEPSATTETADADDDAATDEADAAEGDDADGDDLEEIKGVGPAYAQRLRDAGVGSVADLADADAEALAEETDLSPNRIGNWIERARAR